MVAFGPVPRAHPSPRCLLPPFATPSVPPFTPRRPCWDVLCLSEPTPRRVDNVCWSEFCKLSVESPVIFFFHFSSLLFSQPTPIHDRPPRVRPLLPDTRAGSSQHTPAPSQAHASQNARHSRPRPRRLCVGRPAGVCAAVPAAPPRAALRRHRDACACAPAPASRRHRAARGCATPRASRRRAARRLPPRLHAAPPAGDHRDAAQSACDSVHGAQVARRVKRGVCFLRIRWGAPPRATTPTPARPAAGRCVCASWWLQRWRRLARWVGERGGWRWGATLLTPNT